MKLIWDSLRSKEGLGYFDSVENKLRASRQKSAVSKIRSGESHLQFNRLSKVQRESLQVRDQNALSLEGQRQNPKSLSREIDPTRRPRIDQSLEAIFADKEKFFEAHDRPMPQRVESLLQS